MTRLSDTISIVEELNKRVEVFWMCPRDELISLYAEYQKFNAQLNSLMSIIAKYRYQLAVQNPPIFGPKTQVTVRLVDKYDKIYAFNEDQLVDAFKDVEQLAYVDNIGLAQEEDKQLLSIAEDTRRQLEAIEIRRNAPEPPAIRFEGVKSSLTHPNGLVIHDSLRSLFAACPSNLQQAIPHLLHHHPDQFPHIIAKVAQIISQVAKRPDEIANRLLRVNNQNLQADILQYTHSIALFKSLGYKLCDYAEIEPMLIQAGLGDVIRGEPDELYLFLAEPDVFGEFEEWKRWLERVKGDGKVLEKVWGECRKGCGEEAVRRGLGE